MRLYRITPADIGDLKNVTIAALTDALQPLIQGAVSDLQQYASDIVSIAIDAGAAGDQDTLNQLKDQAVALLEANRLRVAAATQATINAVMTAVLNFALKLATNVAVPGGGALLPPITIQL